jgi:glycosyltransferase involved in cell wall biosynthesis
MCSESVNVSIILCVYNAQETVGRTLECIFGSDLTSFEVIVVDDASTDRTKDICREFQVQLLEQPVNRGPSVCRNLGVRHSNAPYLFFLDSDIVFPPHLLRRMLTLLEEDAHLAGVGSISSPEPLNPNFFSRYFAVQEYIQITRVLGREGRALRPFISTRCGCIRRSVFQEVGGFNESYRKPSIEDYEFSLRLHGKYLLLYDQTLLHQHHFPDSFLKIFRRYHRNTLEMLLLLHGRRTAELGPLQSDARARLLLGLSGVCCILGLGSPAFIPFALLLLGAAGWMQRGLLQGFYRHGGLLFSLKAWLAYSLFSLAVGTGLAAGLWKLVRRKPSRGRQPISS